MSLDAHPTSEPRRNASSVANRVKELRTIVFMSRGLPLNDALILAAAHPQVGLRRRPLPPFFPAPLSYWRRLDTAAGRAMAEPDAQ